MGRRIRFSPELRNREVREWKRANGIVRKASAYLAQKGLDRRGQYG